MHKLNLPEIYWNQTADDKWHVFYRTDGRRNYNISIPMNGKTKIIGVFQEYGTSHPQEIAFLKAHPAYSFRIDQGGPK